MKMICRSLAGRARQPGVVAVEFALVLPVLLLLVFGVINFGIAMYDIAVAHNAARVAARWQAISTNYKTLVSNTLTDGRKYDTGATPVTCGAVVDPPTNAVEVACNYAAGLIINLGGQTQVKVTVRPDSSADPKQVTVSVFIDYNWLGYISFLDLNDQKFSAAMYYE